MPLLIYSCQACGEEVEFLLDRGQEPEDACKCGAARWLRGMPRRIGIRFKGSGFYKTDSRAANGEGRTAKPAGKADGKADGKAKATGKESPGREKGAS